jgi:hypothetical protein
MNIEIENKIISLVADAMLREVIKDLKNISDRESCCECKKEAYLQAEAIITRLLSEKTLKERRVVLDATGHFTKKPIITKKQYEIQNTNPQSQSLPDAPPKRRHRKRISSSA